MKIDRFDPPGNNDDFGSDAALKEHWNQTMSGYFDTGVNSVTTYLAAHGGGTCQFYNPLTQRRTDPDLPPADLTWNGFPKNLSLPGPVFRPGLRTPNPRFYQARSDRKTSTWSGMSRVTDPGR